MLHRKGYWLGLWILLLLVLLACSSPPRPATPTATAVGLNAQFYPNPGFSGPALVRLEPRLALAGQVPGLRPGPFSARYEGTLLAPKDGEYTLHLVGQGQARLYLEGRLVAQELPVSTRLRLCVGQPVGLRLEYQILSGPARLRLDWEGPGLARQAVPPHALRPAEMPPQRADLTPQAVSRGWELLWNPDFEQGPSAWVELAGGQISLVAGRQGGQALQAQNWTYAAQSLPWMYVQMGPTRPQTEADISFRGGVPRMPAELELPHCQKCGDEQTFFFQVAFPEKHLWHGWVMCVFNCSSCFDKDDRSPRGGFTHKVLPDGCLDRNQTDYRIILYPADSPTARMRTEARQLLKFEEIRFEKLRVNNRHYETKLGGKPFWIDDPRPIEEIEYMGGRFVFIGQFMEEFNFFPALEDAPRPRHLASGYNTSQ